LVKKAFAVEAELHNFELLKTNVALTKWLRIKIKPGQTDLIVFFAGHGVASKGVCAAYGL